VQVLAVKTKLAAKSEAPPRAKPWSTQSSAMPRLPPPIATPKKLPFLSTGKNKGAAFKGKFRELSTKIEQCSLFKKNINVPNHKAISQVLDINDEQCPEAWEMRHHQRTTIGFARNSMRPT
jgi:hypothetical protein